MESPDSTMTVKKRPSGSLRRSVASAKDPNRSRDTTDELDMDAFRERLESDKSDQLLASSQGVDRSDSRTTSNAAEKDVRHRRQRKVNIVKRIRRKHGFKIMTVTLLFAFLWLLWMSGS